MKLSQFVNIVAERIEKARIRLGGNLDRLADYLDNQLERVPQGYRNKVLKAINKTHERNENFLL